LTDLTFSYLADKKMYETAFCVNPPDDVCPFGLPCPNADVTGLGQQISIYITTVIYAIVLIYIPSLQRPMFYAHLALLYSLLIAAMVSVCNGELSRADGIFVIITVASPASLYLWYYSLRSIWNANYFPMQHLDREKPKGRSREVYLARVLSLGSFAFEIAMIFVLFIPNVKGIKFPQAACDQSYDAMPKWYMVAWELPVAIQSVVITLFYFLALLCVKLWTKRTSYKAPSSSHVLQPLFDQTETAPRENVDLVSWTWRLLCDQYPNFMSRTLFRVLVFVGQLAILPDVILVYRVKGKDCAALLLIAVGLFLEPPRMGVNRVKIFLIRIVVLLFLGGVVFIRLLISFAIPSCTDWVIIFIAVSAASASWTHFSKVDMKIFLPVVIISLTVAISFSNVGIVYLGDPYAIGFRSPTREPSYFPESFAGIDTVTPVVWIICWLATSVWPWHSTLTSERLKQGLWKRAHLLKMCSTIVGPHLLWIKASSKANPTHSRAMTFGQIFAMIVSFASLLCLADVSVTVKKDVWLSVLISEAIVDEQSSPSP
ncbi:hypothetical protein DFP72DRAFT_756251, partial [Ephemerocybe angulata]